MATPLSFQIMSLIQAELKDAGQLLGLLQQEAGMLAQRKLDQLGQIIEQKSQLLVALEQAGGKRKALLDANQLPPNDVGWRNLMAKGRDQALMQNWAKLEKLIKQCKAANETNGKLLNRSQRSLSQLTQLLKGQKPAENLYTAKGTYKAQRAALTYTQA
ncbi:flagella synthesis protein FlgN [Simiduia agarivorans]|uniref:FlgN superfamily protein n=1 Tax=Simiduia agarivorans (strain DSM 21679 / JCM 13881 / BCRC 17597 / SA1) TaxID=1117647 RepID=K4KHL9_SIMAS|nr:flagellar protein FlgN [Simiduia agarivorans]AFU97655.1 FlgN superfamily protein [Simiduia agarivorans SA1 = DSM 21679]